MTDLELRELNPLDHEAVDGWIAVVRASAAHDKPELPMPSAARLRLRFMVAVPGVAFFRAVAVTDGVVVGCLELLRDLENNAHLMVGDLHVHPDYRRHRVGARLLQYAQRQAGQLGVRTLMFQVSHDFVATPNRLSAGKAFAESQGLTVGQVTVHNIKDVVRNDGEELRLLYDAAVERSAEYDAVSWGQRVPDELIEGYCHLKGRIVTDAPTGELDMEEEQFMPEAVRLTEASLADRGTIVLGTAARHRRTGEVVGFTEIRIAIGDERDCHISDTIVAPEHRGHRLGARIKLVNERQLARWRPQMRYVHTWNADDNRHMIAVNEQIGYRPYCTATYYQWRLN